MHIMQSTLDVNVTPWSYEWLINTQTLLFIPFLPRSRPLWWWNPHSNYSIYCRNKLIRKQIVSRWPGWIDKRNKSNVCRNVLMLVMSQAEQINKILLTAAIADGKVHKKFLHLRMHGAYDITHRGNPYPHVARFHWTVVFTLCILFAFIPRAVLSVQFVCA